MAMMKVMVMVVMMVMMVMMWMMKVMMMMMIVESGKGEATLFFARGSRLVIPQGDNILTLKAGQ